MVIDFHTHIFPEKIASSTLQFLTGNTGNPAHNNGMQDGLIAEMEKAGVDISIALPVLTKPSQFDTVAKFAISVNEQFKDKKRKIISFGGMHPQCDNIPEKMKFLKDNGIKGIKLHPDFQNTFFDDEKYIEIINCAKDNDMIVVTHSGIDDGYIGQPVKCPPVLVKKVVEKVGYKKFVLGHYGAHKQWQEVLDLLSDLDVYFDTALAPKKIDKDLFNKILLKHGSDRVLFATDSPWGDVNEDILLIKEMVKDKSALDNIFYKNACKLLGIGE